MPEVAAEASPAVAPSPPDSPEATATDAPAANEAAVANEEGQSLIDRQLWEPHLTTWQRFMSLSNTLSYLVLLGINILVNSGALWPASKRDIPTTPARWAFYIRDFVFFWQGLGIICHNFHETKRWKATILDSIGFGWQLLWYAECTWYLLYVSETWIGLLLSPLFSFSALAAAASTSNRLAKAVPEINLQMQQQGWEGMPSLAYLLYIFPTSIMCGWLLVLHCHTSVVSLAASGASLEAQLTFGSLLLVVATVMALVVLLQSRDVTFGIAFCYAMLGVMMGPRLFVNEDESDDDVEEASGDQLVAFFCSGIMQVATVMSAYNLFSFQFDGLSGSR